MLRVQCEYCAKSPKIVYVGESYPVQETDPEDGETYTVHKDIFACSECWLGHEIYPVWGLAGKDYEWRRVSNFFPLRKIVTILDWFDAEVNHHFEWLCAGIPESKFEDGQNPGWRFELFCWLNQKVCTAIACSNWWTR